MSTHPDLNGSVTMTTVIKGGLLINGTGRDPLPNATVVVEGDSIVDVTAGGKARVPHDARIIDATGCTILPGFIDCHVHLIAYEYNLEKRLATPSSLTILRTVGNLRATLEAGITTARDAGGIDVGFKSAVEQGLVVGPRLLVSIVGLAQTGNLFDLAVNSGAQLDRTGVIGRVLHYCGGVETLRQKVRELLLAGADVMKICTTGSVHTTPDRIPPPHFSSEEIDAVVYEAHAADRRVMAHAEGGPGVRAAVEAGIDSIEHGFYLSDEDIQCLVKNSTFLVPTLAFNLNVLDVAENNPAAGIDDDTVQGARKVIADHAESFRRAVEAGVRIAMGSDAFGLSQGKNLFELELMVRFGMTPMQAIVAGTRVAAECLGMENRLGTVTPGKIADMLVVNGDPLTDIRVLQAKDNLSVIMKGGELFKNAFSAGLEGDP